MSDDESDDSFGDADGEHGEGEDAPDKKTYVRQYGSPRPETHALKRKRNLAPPCPASATLPKPEFDQCANDRSGFPDVALGFGRNTTVYRSAKRQR